MGYGRQIASRRVSGLRRLERCEQRPCSEASAALSEAPAAAAAGGRRPSGTSAPARRARSVARAETLPAVVGLQLPAHDVVGEVELEHLVEPRLVLGVDDRHQHLDATIEVARHQVGRADEVQRSGRRRRVAVARTGRSGSARGSDRAASARGWSRTDRARRHAGSRCRGRRGRSARPPRLASYSASIIVGRRSS